MNKLGMVLGIAAVATLAGCKDPDYKYENGGNAQNEVKSVESQPADVSTQPISIESAPVAKCTCLPGTKHAAPCPCGASDCKCIVETSVTTKADVSKPVAAATPEYTTYVVQKGDVLSKIAQKYHVKLSDLRAVNPKVRKDVIWVGMKLKLPGKVDVGPQAAPAASAPAVKKTAAAAYTGATKEYVVRSGDTLGAIAYGNGMTIRQLKNLNGLTKDSLRVGQKLKVPAAKVVAAKAAKSVAKKSAVKKDDAKKAAAPEKTEAASAAPAAASTPAAPAAEASSAAPATPATPVAPAVEASSAAPAAPAAPAATYVVQEGDDMTGVSIRWGVSAAAIRELNNLPDDAQLVPGQILKLPADAQQ